MKLDLSDIGLSKINNNKVDRPRSKRTILLSPVSKGKWEEIDFDTVSPTKFIKAITKITGGFVSEKGPYGIKKESVENYNNKEHLLNSIIAFQQQLNAYFTVKPR